MWILTYCMPAPSSSINHRHVTTSANVILFVLFAGVPGLHASVANNSGGIARKTSSMLVSPRTTLSSRCEPARHQAVG